MNISVQTNTCVCGLYNYLTICVSTYLPSYVYLSIYLSNTYLSESK